MGKHEDVTMVVRTLCKGALEAKLKLRDFHSLWPREADVDTFLRQVFEDIEDAVEHTPGHLLRGGVDYKSWYKSDMYVTLCIDYTLLSYNKSSDDLLRCRETLLNSGISNKDAIREAAERCLNP